jgi:hypothetical protein
MYLKVLQRVLHQHTMYQPEDIIEIQSLNETSEHFMTGEAPVWAALIEEQAVEVCEAPPVIRPSTVQVIAPLTHNNRQYQPGALIHVDNMLATAWQILLRDGTVKAV